MLDSADAERLYGPLTAARQHALEAWVIAKTHHPAVAVSDDRFFDPAKADEFTLPVTVALGELCGHLDAADIAFANGHLGAMELHWVLAAVNARRCFMATVRGLEKRPSDAFFNEVRDYIDEVLKILREQKLRTTMSDNQEDHA